MSLFVRASDKSRIKFEFVELSPEELEDITKLVQTNGGEVGENNIPVKFIPRKKYKDGMYPWNILYDINYIGKCITAKRLVQLRPFRLTPKRFAERCMSTRFLHGCCCYKKALMETQIRGSPIILSSCSSDEEEVATQEWVDTEWQLVTNRLQAEDDAKTNIEKNPSDEVDIKPNVLELNLPTCKTPRQDALPIEVSSSQEGSSVYATPAEHIEIKEEVPDSEAWGNKPETPLRLIPPEERSTRSHASSPAGVDDIIPSISYIAKVPITETSTNIPPAFRNPMTLPPLAESFESPPAAVAEKSVTASAVNTSSPTKPARQRSSPNESENHLDSPVINNIKEETPDSVPWDDSPGRQSFSVAPGESSPPNRVSSLASVEDVTSSPDFVEGSITGKTTNTPPTPQIDQSQLSKPTESAPSSVVDKSPTAPIVDASRKTPVKRRPLTIKSDIRPESDPSKNLRRDASDEWISVKKNTKRDESVKEYTLPGGARVPLLRQNFVSVEPNEDSSSTDSLSEIFSPERDTGKKKTTTIGSRMTTNGSLCDEAGPSTGKGRQCSSFASILTVDNSTDDDGDVATREVTPPELWSNKSDSRSQKEPNKSNFVKNETRSVKSKSGTKRKTTAKRKNTTPKESRNAGSDSSANVILISSDSDTEPMPRNSKRRKVDASQRSRGIRASEDEGSDEKDNRGPWFNMRVKGNVVVPEPRARKARNVRKAKEWRHNLDANRPADFEPTKMHFIAEERRTMIEYLCTFDNIRAQRPKGYTVWQQMIQSGLLTHRTPQSLQNHFAKILLPNIEQFFEYMTAEQQKQFLSLKGVK